MAKDMSKNRTQLETFTVQAGHYVDPATGAVVPPIQPSSTFARNEDYSLQLDYSYSRAGNPALDQAEKILAELDGGADAKLFNSGMSAIAAFAETLKSGDRLVAPEVMYHGGQTWFFHLQKQRGIELAFFDQTKEGALEEALRGGDTKVLWIESPVNPTWEVIDIEYAAKLAHDVGAILVCDSTVAPPCTCKPLELGADMVFHSATKYLNGHSDLTAGVLVTKEKNERWDSIEFARLHLGNLLPAFEAWLLIRGMRTLFVRFERASTNAFAIAEHFENHPKLEAVLYPGLKSHAGHSIAAKQMTSGFGGMMSFLVSGSEKQTQKIATSVRVFHPATSLGGVESLIEHRKVVEGPHSIVPGNLLRLSIGIESVEDLIADLEQALAQI